MHVWFALFNVTFSLIKVQYWTKKSKSLVRIQSSVVSGRDSILLCVSVWQKAKNSSLKNFYVVKRDFAEVQINFFYVLWLLQ